MENNLAIKHFHNPLHTDAKGSSYLQASCMEQNNRTMEEKGWEKVPWDPVISWDLVTSENQGASKEESTQTSLEFRFSFLLSIFLIALSEQDILHTV